jgi:hypothetical protein
MLPDGIVVEAEMLGELGNLDRPRFCGDVAEELMTRRITECSRLELQRAHRAPPSLIERRPCS